LIRIACLLAVVASACSGLEPLTPSCGNGVVEPGEDCDSGADCRACSLVCSAGVMCPDDYTCGVDQLCHAPGGRFHDVDTATTISFEALGFGITDTNKDGYGDVVSLGGTSLTAYYGDANATLSNQLHMITPELFSAPAVTHLDADPTLDLVLPTADGLLAYTSPFAVPSPYSFPIEVSGATGGPRELYVFPLDGPFLGLVLDDRMGHLALSIIDGSLKNDLMAATTPPVVVCAGMTPAQLDPRDRDTYATPADHLLALTTMTGAICEIEVSGAANTITSHVVATTTTAGTTALFAHLGLASSCPSLLVATASGYAELPGSGAPGTCTTALTKPIFPPGQLIGRVPLGAGVADALASTAGIFTLTAAGTPNAPLLYPAVRPLDAIQIVDINGDGLDDVIASSKMFDDLAVLVRYGSGAAGGFLAQSIDTTGVPLNVVTGDFDGDGVGDVTYTEKLANGERLMIAFGGHDSIQPPRFVSMFTNVVETAGIGLQSSTDPTGTRVRDLIVLDRPIADQETLLLTVMYGSPQRTLLPFFDPRPTSRLAQSFGMRSTTAGDFGHTAGNYKELFAIEETSSVPQGTYAYLIDPDVYGAMSVTGSFASPNIEVCSQASHDGLCIDGANFTTYRANAAATHDLVVGLDTSALYHAVAFDPSGLALTPPQLPMQPISLVAAGLVSGAVTLFPHQLYVADIDGDGTNELVAGYAPTGPNDVTLGTVIACHPSSDGTIACFAPTLDGWTCSAMAPANVVRHERFDAPLGRTSQDFVAVCAKAKTDPHPELVHFWYDGGAYHSEPMFGLPVNTRYVVIGDVTGDGIDDVLAFDKEPQTAMSTAIPLLHVYVQCTSREAASCPPLDAEAP
jgi:hypothetical protein